MNKEPQVLSLEQYLGRIGLSLPVSDYSLDKARLPHGETAGQRKKRIHDAEMEAGEYSKTSKSHN